MANTKLTEEVKGIIYDTIKNGGTDKEAYTAAGIDRSTFYRYLNGNSDFCDYIKNAREERTKQRLKTIQDAAESGLITLLRGQEYDETKTETKTDPKTGETYTNITVTHKVIPPNPTAVVFALCNRDPSRWQNRVTGEVKQEIKTETTQKIDLSRVKDSTIQELIKELEAVPLPE